ncbi:unnamed protein product, partial [Musa acuminata subsp. burmannicoides]
PNEIHIKTLSFPEFNLLILEAILTTLVVLSTHASLPSTVRSHGILLDQLS